MDTPQIPRNRTQQHAIVLGAGMAGLVAARVLTDHFDRVTIVEQDALPAAPAARHGTPQAHHVHVLLNSGKTILTRLFPGLTEDLEQSGVPRVDGINDLAWLTRAGWGIRYPSKYLAQPASRPLLEWIIRQRLVSNSRVQFLTESSAAELLASADRRRVLGVRLRRHGESEGAMEQLTADLIVDTTGRGSRAVQWLRDLGYPEPPRTEINAHFGYTSRFFRLPPDPRRDWQALYIQADLPLHLRGGILMRLENDRWICTLGGYARNYPPTDEAGFLAFAQSLRSPRLFEAIKDGEPLSAPIANRSGANIWRHFERLSRWPDGFIIMGDAVCAFNPVYGQGMSVAAKEAMDLDASLRVQRQRRPDGDLTGFAARFQRQLPKTIQSVWTIATGEDVRVPGAEGGTSGRLAHFIHGYLDRVLQLTTEDIWARQALVEVLNLDQPALLLFHPRLIAKVILGPTGRTAPGPAAAPPSVAP